MLVTHSVDKKKEHKLIRLELTWGMKEDSKFDPLVYDTYGVDSGFLLKVKQISTSSRYWNP